MLGVMARFCVVDLGRFCIVDLGRVHERRPHNGKYWESGKHEQIRNRGRRKES